MANEGVEEDAYSKLRKNWVCLTCVTQIVLGLGYAKPNCAKCDKPMTFSNYVIEGGE